MASSSSITASSAAINTASAIAILATAIPTSLAYLYLTNSASANDLVKSELSAGSTPAWIASLPSTLQTYLLNGLGTPTAGASSSQPPQTSNASASQAPSRSTPTANQTSQPTDAVTYPQSPASGTGTTTQSAMPKQTGDNGSALSSGAKAGIGAGIGILASLLIALGVFLLRGKRRTRDTKPMDISASRRPYMDSKAEVDGNSRQEAADLAGPEVGELPDREPQEVDAQVYARTPLPVPLSSKPSMKLDAGYRGHETAGSALAVEMGVPTLSSGRQKGE